MIMIDVLVPPLDRIFDFEVDETVDGRTLRTKLEKLIEMKERVKFSLEKRELFLYRVGDFLNESEPLNDQDIRNGDRLILI